jgi:hypothetical protein
MKEIYQMIYKIFFILSNFILIIGVNKIYMILYPLKGMCGYEYSLRAAEGEFNAVWLFFFFHISVIALFIIVHETDKNYKQRINIIRKILLSIFLIFISLIYINFILPLYFFPYLENIELALFKGPGIIIYLIVYIVLILRKYVLTKYLGLKKLRNKKGRYLKNL